MPPNNKLEKQLWEAADQLRANSSLTAQEYSKPVLGLIFLKYADHRFGEAEKELESANISGRRSIGKTSYQAKGVMYLPKEARYSHLMDRPEGSDIGTEINDAMEAIENENEDLRGVLPREYNNFESPLLFALLKTFNSIPMDIEGDVFGKIYEYFLGKFALTEGRGGGEFFTPTSIVKLIVNIIEPYHGRIYDPACGSGGMFVQSANFVKKHNKSVTSEIGIYGQESKDQTVRLCRMNLAVHGLPTEGIKQGNTYYEDPHNSIGKFDFVMANPPFNVNGIDKERIKDDKRYKLGIPRTDNGNYLWIQDFYSALNDKGRAGFVMANSAADARQSELEIRKKLIKSGHVDVIISISPNFFYTVILPVTLWFFDKNKRIEQKQEILFIDARNIYYQVDRSHRDFKPEQLEFITNIVKLYRGKNPDISFGSQELMNTNFKGDKYEDVEGLCKVATIEEIEYQGWSLNPLRYVGLADEIDDGIEFERRISDLKIELEKLNLVSNDLDIKIAKNLNKLVN